MSEAVFHSLDRDAVLADLRRYAAEDLASRAEVREVILFGSLARGDHSGRSDADIVVIVDASHERGPFRGPAYFPSRALLVPVDVLVYALGERGAWSKRFRAEIERGIVLYRRD